MKLSHSSSVWTSPKSSYELILVLILQCISFPSLVMCRLSERVEHAHLIRKLNVQNHANDTFLNKGLSKAETKLSLQKYIWLHISTLWDISYWWENVQISDVLVEMVCHCLFSLCIDFQHLDLLKNHPHFKTINKGEPGK